jgi:hypothetical protein
MGKAMLIAVAISAASALAQPVTVPFVGCKSAGQANPVEAPVGEAKTVAMSTEKARELAYYKAEVSLGVLAPRGWFCLGVYGSSSAGLWMSPSVIDPKQVFSSKWNGFTGPVVALSGIDGGGSFGAYQVSRVVARVFPAHRSFLKGFLADGLELPIGPYPGDKLMYKSKDIVEYVTPARAEGLGTQFGVRSSANPIAGVAILTPPRMDLDLLSVRLPPNLAHLAPIIVRQVESDVAKNDREPR